MVGLRLLSRRAVRAPRACLALTGSVGVASAAASFAGTGALVDAIGAGAAASVLLSARRLSPRVPWLLLAAAPALFVAADVVGGDDATFVGGARASASVADAAYLGAYAALAAGVMLLVRRRSSGGDWAALIDSLAVATGVSLLAWIFLVAPRAHERVLPLDDKLLAIAFPLLDVLLVAAVARLAIRDGARSGSFFLLSGGIGAFLATDTVLRLFRLHGWHEPGGLLDGGWIASFVLLAAAALHPSARTLAEPVPEGHPAGERRRLGLLGGSAGVVAVATGVGVFAGEATAASAVASATLAVLAAGRIAVLVRTHADAERRERSLREASAALVGATDRPSVVEAALAAARKVVRAGAAVAVRVDGVETGDEPAGPPTAVVPLLLGDRSLGQLVVSTASPLAPRTRESLGALATQVALSLERADLTQSVHRRDSDARVAALVQKSSDAIAVVDAGGRVGYVTPSVERVLGYLPENLVGTNFLDLVADPNIERVESILLRADDEAVADRVEYRVRHADGRIVDVVTIRSDLRDDPRVGGIVLTTRDISERKRFEEELQHQAFHDALTGLANRALFRDRLEHALALHRLEGRLVAVVFLDLDDFKTINDSLGHLTGDQLLHDIGQRILGCVRESDTAARIGGDEFGVLLEGLEEPEAATVVAERILDALQRPFVVDGRALSVQASLGLAFGDADDTDTPAEALLRNADVAMYAAKSSGKRGYHVFEPAMHAAVLTRGTLNADLVRALQEDQLVVHYQPIVSLADGRIAGFEALVRWHHPTRGLVDPNEFIPLAEESGLIVPIGRLVLRETCSFGAALQERRPREPTWISVNLSARQLQQRSLPEAIRHALETAGLAPSELVLEITESTVMEDVETSIARMHELKRLGIRLAVDDFGSGYSSLNYLRRFPVDLLKIDRSFVSETREGEVSPLTKAIVELARVMGLQPVAEGIESREQMARLAEVRCELGQGFLFSEPLPHAEALALLSGTEQAAA